MNGGKTNWIDDIESWDPPEVLKTYGVGGIVGFDKEGCPVWLDKAPLFDWRGTFKHTVESKCILRPHAFLFSNIFEVQTQIKILSYITKLEFDFTLLTKGSFTPVIY